MWSILKAFFHPKLNNYNMSQQVEQCSYRWYEMEILLDPLISFILFIYFLYFLGRRYGYPKKCRTYRKCSPNSNCICSSALWDSLEPTFNQCSLFRTLVIPWSSTNSNFTLIEPSLTEEFKPSFFFKKKKIMVKMLLKLKSNKSMPIIIWWFPFLTVCAHKKIFPLALYLMIT